MKKYIVMIGNYGSGKTELSLNFAMKAAAEGKRVEVIDLDIVNTYFRLSDRIDVLGKDIRVVSPNFIGKNVEALSVPAEVASAFTLDWDLVIFDVGGDPAGATALGRYQRDFLSLPEGSLSVYNVVNAKRPMSDTPERIIKLMEDMEYYSRLKVTGFINNTNLSTLSSTSDLGDGYDAIRGASELAGIPVAFTTGREENLNAFLSEERDPKFIGQPMVVKTYMHRDWESFTTKGL